MRISDWSSDVCSSDLKYVDHKDAYKSVGEALKHGGIRQRTRVNLKWLESQDIERDGAAKVLEGLDGILVPGGFGDRGFEGKVLAAQYARENDIPYLGICYGMQAAVVDVARNLAGLEDANRSEEHTSELQSLMRISYAVFCLKKK